MDFKAATDVLLGTNAVTAAEIAERLGKDPHTIRRARMSGPNSRSAPEGWQVIVAELAERHADALEQQVKSLRSLVQDLRKYIALPFTDSGVEECFVMLEGRPWYPRHPFRGCTGWRSQVVKLVDLIEEIVLP